MPMNASLVPLPIKDTSKPILLDKNQTSIGRASTNTIQLTHGGVSRTHAVIAIENEQYVLNDLGSRNGTYLNNKKIDRTVLRNGDKIMFGKRGFVFQIDGPSAQKDPLAFSPDFEETVSISTEELEQSRLQTHNAHAAAQSFFERSATDEKQSEEIEKTHERISGLYHLTEGLRMARDPDEILEEGLAFIFHSLPSAQRAVAMLRSKKTGALEARVVRFRDPDNDEDNIPVSRSILDRVLQERVAIINRNLQDDPQFSQSDSIVCHNLNSIICVPLMKRDTVIGALHIDNSNCLDSFSHHDMEFVAAVSNELALSIINDQLQKELIRNESMAAIGLTVTNLAHNIKNLLTVQMSSVDLLDTELKNSEYEGLTKGWHLVRGSLEKIAGLTSEMLDYTRDDCLNPVPMDMNAVIEAECEIYKNNLAAEGIRLEFELCPDLPEWVVDKKHLQQALLDLLVNAKDALSDVDDGCIKIPTELDVDRGLSVRVADNGCGIPKDAHEKIFDLFYTTKGMNGTGIGLAMIKKFV